MQHLALGLATEPPSPAPESALAGSDVPLSAPESALLIPPAPLAPSEAEEPLAADVSAHSPARSTSADPDGEGEPER